jgi:hypothetical protein
MVVAGSLPVRVPKLRPLYDTWANAIGVPMERSKAVREGAERIMDGNAWD